MTETWHLDDDALLGLVLGELSQPDHDRSVQHLTECLSCRLEYDHVAGGIDLVLPAAPRLAAPAGFETQVLQRMQPVPSNTAPVPHHRNETARRRSRRRTLQTAAVGSIGVVAGVLGAGLLWPSDTAAPTLPSAQPDHAVLLTDQEERNIGWVADAYAASGEMLVITLEGDSPGARLTCRGILPDGTTENLGSWYSGGGSTDTWIIEDVPEQIQALELVDDSGEVHGTATLTP